MGKHEIHIIAARLLAAAFGIPRRNHCFVQVWHIPFTDDSAHKIPVRIAFVNPLIAQTRQLDQRAVAVTASVHRAKRSFGAFLKMPSR